MSGIKNRILAVLLMLAMLLSSLPVLGEGEISLAPEQIEALTAVEEMTEEVIEEAAAEETAEEVETEVTEEATEETTEEAETEVTEEATEETTEEVETEVTEEVTEETTEEVEGEVSEEAVEAIEGEAAAANASDFEIENGILKKYKGIDPEVTVPSGVTTISSNAFNQNMLITRVTLPESVTAIAGSAFSYCLNLESVKLSSKVKTIGDNAFANCVKLEEINIPASVTTIGARAFSSCQKLTAAAIPAKASVGSNAFNDCASLKTVTIGSGASFASSIFAGCTSLSEITLPTDMTSIPSGFFEGCTSLKEVNLPAGLTAIGESAFSTCIDLEEIKLPASVTTIGRRAFEHCISMEEITLSRSITSIGLGAFNDCGDLCINVYEDSFAHNWCVGNRVKYDTIVEIDFTFTIADGAATITGYTGTAAKAEIPATIKNNPVTAIASKAFENQTVLTSISIPNTVATIGSSAFAGSGLVSVDLPAALTKIEDRLFYNCASLMSVSIPAGVTEIEDQAFCKCPKLSSISLPTGLTAIGSYAFSDAGLTAITIPAAVTSIGTRALDAYALSTISVDAANTAYTSKDDVLFNKACTTLITYPDAKTSVGYSVPSGVKEIEDYAFMGVDRLYSVSLPTSVTTIGEFAFSNCALLASLNLSAAITKIGEEAFTYSKKLTPVVEDNSYAHTYCAENGVPFELVSDTCNHQWSDWTIISAASCLKEGSQTRICSVCSKVETVTVPALGHTLNIIPAVEPTCTQTGLTMGEKCSVCGTVTLMQEVVPAKGHTEIVIPGYPANEIAPGLTDGKKCSVCGVITVPQEVIPELNYVIELEQGTNDSFALYIGESVQLEATFAYENDWEVKSWKSGSSKVASVDEDGLVTGLKEGTATITVTTKNSKKATIKIKVLDPYKPSEIILNGHGTLKMGVDEEFQLDVAWEPADLDCEVTYKSSSTKYASVDEDGLITANRTGSAKITVTVTSESGAKLSKTFSVSVKKPATKINLDESEVMVAAGSEPFSLDYSFNSSSYASVLTWSSSDEDVAYVDPVTGEITPLEAGVAEITVETYNGLSDSCTVNVCGEPAEIYIPETDLVMSYKQTANLNAILLDDEGNETLGELEYESSHPKNVSVSSSGKITIKKSTKGVATITVSTEDGSLSETVSVEVVSAPSKVTLEETKIELEVGDEYEIIPEIPEDSVCSFTYSSSKSSVASVDEDGVVTPKKEGTAKITVKTHNGKKATLTVNVVDPYAPTKIVLEDEGTIELYEGETYDLYYEIFPEDANDIVEWSSSRTSYATVDEDGVVTALRGGKTVTITVETYNGKEDSVKIKILDEDD